MEYIRSAKYLVLFYLVIIKGIQYDFLVFPTELRLWDFLFSSEMVGNKTEF
jgi:hypothetical protein